MATSIVTPTQDAVSCDVFIAAPRERVYKALSDPTEVVKWWGQAGMYHTSRFEMDLRPGGKWRSIGSGADGKTFHVDGEYREVDPPRLIVYTWRSSWFTEAETIVRVELEAEQSGTRVRIHHSGFAGFPAAAKDHGNGWARVLSWLQGYVERNETVDTRPAPKA